MPLPEFLKSLPLVQVLRKHLLRLRARHAPIPPLGLVVGYPLGVMPKEVLDAHRSQFRRELRPSEYLGGSLHEDVSPGPSSVCDGWQWLVLDLSPYGYSLADHPSPTSSEAPVDIFTPAMNERIAELSRLWHEAEAHLDSDDVPDGSWATTWTSVCAYERRSFSITDVLLADAAIARLGRSVAASTAIALIIPAAARAAVDNGRVMCYVVASAASHTTASRGTTVDGSMIASSDDKGEQASAAASASQNDLRNPLAKALENDPRLLAFMAELDAVESKTDDPTAVEAVYEKHLDGLDTETSRAIIQAAIYRQQQRRG
ncbi:MAG: hypothetical protein ACKVS8_08805 [Phycisphaerales bacterium]